MQAEHVNVEHIIQYVASCKQSKEQREDYTQVVCSSGPAKVKCVTRGNVYEEER